MMKSFSITVLVAAWILSTGALVTGCKSAPKKPELTQSQLRQKKVALVEVRGAKDAELQIEVAVVNEVIENGRFHIIDRKSVQDALVTAPHESDWPRLGHALGADLILAIDVLEFKTDKREGYDAVEEQDTILAAEHGTDRDKKWRKYYKVRQREGFVKIKVRFFDVAAGREMYSGESEATATHNTRDGDMPRAMKLLETLTAQAFSAYFQGLPE